MSKSGLGPIAKAYIKTLHTSSSDQLCITDALLQIGLPIVIGTMLYFLAPGYLHCISDASQNAIMAISIVSALLCALAVMVFQLRVQIMDMSEFSPASKEVQLIDELFSMTLWSVIAGFLTVILMVCAGPLELASEGLGAAIWAASVACSINFALTAAMCMKRLYAAYRIVSHRWPNAARNS